MSTSTSTRRLAAIARIWREFRAIDRDFQKETGIRVEVIDDEHSPFEWHVTLSPTSGNYYGLKNLHLVLTFSERYPEEPPTVNLSSYIPHSNIVPHHGNARNFLCTDLLKNFDWFMGQGTMDKRATTRGVGKTSASSMGWSPAYSMQALLVQIQAFLFDEWVLNYDDRFKHTLWDRVCEEGGGRRPKSEVCKKLHETQKNVAGFQCTKCSLVHDRTPAPVALEGTGDSPGLLGGSAFSASTSSLQELVDAAPACANSLVEDLATSRIPGVGLPGDIVAFVAVLSKKKPSEAARFLVECSFFEIEEENKANYNKFLTSLRPCNASHVIAQAAVGEMREALRHTRFSDKLPGAQRAAGEDTGPLNVSALRRQIETAARRVIQQIVARHRFADGTVTNATTIAPGRAAHPAMHRTRHAFFLEKEVMLRLSLPLWSTCKFDVVFRPAAASFSFPVLQAAGNEIGAEAVDSLTLLPHAKAATVTPVPADADMKLICALEPLAFQPLGRQAYQRQLSSFPMRELRCSNEYALSTSRALNHDSHDRIYSEPPWERALPEKPNLSYEESSLLRREREALFVEEWEAERNKKLELRFEERCKSRQLISAVGYDNGADLGSRAGITGNPISKSVNTKVILPRDEKNLRNAGPAQLDAQELFRPNRAISENVRYLETVSSEPKATLRTRKADPDAGDVAEFLELFPEIVAEVLLPFFTHTDLHVLLDVSQDWRKLSDERLTLFFERPQFLKCFYTKKMYEEDARRGHATRVPVSGLAPDHALFSRTSPRPSPVPLEDLLGVGLQLNATGHGDTQQFCCIYDLLSHKAFHDLRVRKAPLGEAIDFWLPVALDRRHFDSAMGFLEGCLLELYQLRKRTTTTSSRFGAAGILGAKSYGRDLAEPEATGGGTRLRSALAPSDEAEKDKSPSSNRFHLLLDTSTSDSESNLQGDCEMAEKFFSGTEDHSDADEIRSHDFADSAGSGAEGEDDANDLGTNWVEVRHNGSATKQPRFLAISSVSEKLIVKQQSSSRKAKSPRFEQLHYDSKAQEQLCHGVKLTKQVEQCFVKSVLYTYLKLMNGQLVHLMKGDVFASEKALAGYLGFHHSFLLLCEEKPMLRRQIDVILKNFIQHEDFRSKANVPDLGEFLCLLSVSNSFDWHDVVLPLFEESAARAIKWVFDEHKQWTLRRWEQSYDLDTRLKHLFQHTVVGRRLLMFHYWFLTKVARKPHVHEEVSSNGGEAATNKIKTVCTAASCALHAYERTKGVPAPSLVAELRQQVKELTSNTAVSSWETFFQRIGIEFVAEAGVRTTAAGDNNFSHATKLLDRFYKKAAERSERLEYHFSNAAKGMSRKGRGKPGNERRKGGLS
ncbi:unnamed protein product [Amoebophrya sp. A120]|nr:unnamed protein product [Amoebophrya sp. A120]|eukprot:GSA120T00002399001.1